MKYPDPLIKMPFFPVTSVGKVSPTDV